MESLKPLLLLVVLSGVGYGVYVALNRAPPPEPPPGVAPDWNKPVNVEPAGRSTSAPGISGSGSTLLNAAPGKPASSQTPSVAGATNSSQPWKDSVTSAAKRDESIPGAGTASSLPFGIGSANLRSAATPSALPDRSPPGTSAPALDLQGPNNASSSSPSIAPSSSAGQSRYEYDTSRRAAQKYLTQGKLVETLRELSQWYGNSVVPPEDQAALLDMLGQLAGTVIYSRQNWLTPAYRVRSGESLETIAAQYQVPWQILAKINGIEQPYAVYAGEELKVVRGPFHAQLDVGQQCLTLFLDGMYAGRFQVQLGAPVNKPEGAYPIVKFGENQPGVGAAARHISLGGDLQLMAPDDANPGDSTPGTWLGAVRIKRQDLDDVYDMLSERSQVTIRR